MTATAPREIRPHDFLDIDHLLDDEERMIRDTVRAFVTDQVLPYVGDWFEEATIPLELAPALGKIGVLGMHLDGYGCAGMNNASYGLALQEVERGDSNRADYLKRFYGISHESPADYDLVLNTDRLGPEGAVRLIVQAAGAPQPVA